MIFYAPHDIELQTWAGDPYPEKIKKCDQKITERLLSQEEREKAHLSYQIRVVWDRLNGWTLNG